MSLGISFLTQPVSLALEEGADRLSRQRKHRVGALEGAVEQIDGMEGGEITVSKRVGEMGFFPR